MRQLCSCLALVCAVAAGPVSAQVIQPPPRSSNGLFGGPRAAQDPNRTGQELSATVNLLGSYEDDLAPAGEGITTDPLLPRRSGTTGVLSGDMRYRYGSAVRSVDASGQGYVHSFRNIGVTPMYGGNAELRGSTQLGSRTTLTGNAETRYQPTFTLTSGGTPEAELEAPVPTDPTVGILEWQSMTVGAGTMLTRAWSPRQRTNLSYAYSRIRVTGQTPMRSAGQEGALAHEWDARRYLSLSASYKYSGLRSQASGQPSQPVDSHTGDFGFQLRRRLSRTRTLAFTGSAGAMRVKTVSSFDGRPLEYIAPSGNVGVRLDLWRTWAVSADFHRDVTVLEGVTTQSFLSDIGTLWLGGRLGPAWILAVTGQWSQGKPHQGGDLGSFEAGNGTGQVQYVLTRSLTLVGSYAFYMHRLRDVSAVPAGFPRRFERNAVTMGVTIFLPLYGQFPATTGRN
jgi:hypothetical protein